MVKPEYCKNVIVGVIYKKKFAWYITKKDIWYLDYNKRYQAWKEWYKNMGRSEKRFYSCFPETEKYEEYVPDGWEGYYEQFNQFKTHRQSPACRFDTRVKETD